eukprot:407173-Heterocapsa_arctica.AAC.1
MGRQIAWLIYQYFQTNPIMDFTYGIEDLGRRVWTGDHNIPTFLPSLSSSFLGCGSSSLTTSWGRS